MLTPLIWIIADDERSHPYQIKINFTSMTASKPLSCRIGSFLITLFDIEKQTEHYDRHTFFSHHSWRILVTKIIYLTYPS